MCAYHTGVLTVSFSSWPPFRLKGSVADLVSCPLLPSASLCKVGQCADGAVAFLGLTMLTGTAGLGSSSHRLACSASYGHRKGQSKHRIVTRATSGPHP